MNYVVQIDDLQPDGRQDGKMWTTAILEESVTSAGPWSVLETFPLPVYPDAAHPPKVTVRSTIATMDFGFYRVIFEDEDGGFSDPTESVGLAGWAGYLPRVEEVAIWIRARTKDSLGKELGTFTDATRPTRSEVERLIAMVAGNMPGCVGNWLPESLWGKSKLAISLKCAMIVELSYFPEQVDEDQSAYKFLRALFQTEAGDLCSLAGGYAPPGTPGVVTNEPSYYFGDGWFSGNRDLLKQEIESMYLLGDPAIIYQGQV